MIPKDLFLPYNYIHSVDVASKIAEENEKLKKQLRGCEQQLHEQIKIGSRHFNDSER